MPAPGPSLRLRQVQRQTLTMTPALQQSLRLLQLSADELGEAIKEAIESNPLLQPDEVEAPPAPEGPPRPMPRSDLGFRPYNQLAAALGGRRGAQRPDSQADGDLPEPAGNAINETLTEEIAFGFTSATEREVAQMLAGLLDEAGYLAGSIEEVAAACDADEATVEAVLDRLQSIFANGLFARTLAECLALQLDARGALDPPMRALLDNLELVAAGRIDQLSRLAGVDEDAVVAMIAEIRTLDPRPGLAAGAVTATTVIPDLLLSRYRKGTPLDPSRAVRVGDWMLEINPDLQPRVGIDESQYSALRSATRRSDERSYLSERMREARWLLRTLDFRAAAILKIGAAIVSRQADFFDDGVEGLKPLTRREVAEAAEVHESTVSRAVTGKYLASPQGTFELDWFFSAAIADAAGGPPHSARRVRRRIVDLIRAEDRPLSDAALARKLHEEGFALARRTVAKYRETLGIAASAQRRRWQRLRSAGDAG